MSGKSRGEATVTYFGCCLPKPLLEQVDALRGDVNRSRYIQRVIEKNMNAMVQTNPEFERPERLAPLRTKGKGDLSPNG
jgi:hypothetical protein